MSNSLTTSKTPATIVNEIKMMSTTFKGVLFLVEGPADVQFWKIRTTKDNVSLINCEGKTKLLDATPILLQTGFTQLAGVYDADFDHLNQISHHQHVLTPTDHNDLEITLLASDALDMLLHEHGDENLLKVFEATQGVSVAQHIQKLATEFGQLRFLQQKLKHSFSFNTLTPYRFVDQETWTIKKTELHSAYAHLAGLSTENLQALIEQHIPSASGWDLCQGHDALCILAQGLKKTIGNTNKKENEWLKILRGAYSKEMLSKTHMYGKLRTFESTLGKAIF